MINFKATIEVPILSTMIESCGDTLDESHIPLGWPLSVDGAIRQFCMHKKDTIQELDTMLTEFSLQRSSVEINRNTPLLSRSLNRSHVLSTFFGPVLGAMMKQVCWHSRRSEARTQNVMARGQSEAHGNSNLYNTRQDWMIWNQKKTLAMITSQDIHCFHEILQSKMRTHAPCGTLTSKHIRAHEAYYGTSFSCMN